MTATHPAAADNIAYLEQALDLLGQMDNALYRKVVAPCFTSSLGAHYRHVLDHYLRFLDGWAKGTVDYDARERDPRIETDKDYAVQKTRDMMRALGEVRTEDGERFVKVKMACGEKEHESSEIGRSTVDRELQFLISHTVHHYALIAVLLRLEGREPGTTFGVAPSTIRHERKLHQHA